jgi:hypothetical protein
MPEAPVTRRDWMVEIGSLGVLGLNLPTLLAGVARAAPAPRAPPARSCILFFLEGGPAHQDLWDMKPRAPAEVRGEFQPISTSVPGTLVCEHLPLLSQQMHHVAQARAVHHKIVDHNAGAYYALTGREPLRNGRLIVQDEPDNFPPYGSVLARLQPSGRALPPVVQLPDIMSNNGYDLPGQQAGFLGAAYDPFVTGDPSAPGYSAPGLALPSDVPAARLAGRQALRDRLDTHADSWDAGADFATHYRKALELLSTNAARHAFDLDQEPARVRERYGLPDRLDRSIEARKFGGLPHLGQCMLLARRLIEAGVPLVTVCTGRRFDQSWDTHRQHFPLLRQSLLPYADRAFSALLADLAERGLLESTLVVAMGEFGRTPRLGQITSGAGADAAGRDHWPHCYTVLLAGGGIRGGAIYGASDQHAAYPKSDAVTPEDIAATIYHALGISAETQLVDPLGRPHSVALGKPIRALFG